MPIRRLVVSWMAMIHTIHQLDGTRMGWSLGNLLVGVSHVDIMETHLAISALFSEVEFTLIFCIPTLYLVLSELLEDVLDGTPMAASLW